MSLIDRFELNRGEMPFLEHLEELRWRILWSLIALVVGSIVGFVIVSHFDVLVLLIRPIRPYLGGGKLKYLSPAEPFFVTLKLALTAGILLSFPVIAYQLWAFVSPALKPAEKRTIIPFLYFGLVLFLAGMSLAYFAVLPMALRFFMGFLKDSLEQNITVGPYLGLVVKLLLGFGLIFETPVVMLILGTMGIVRSEMLRRTRRYAIVIVFVVSAIMTPPDVFSQCMMAVPLLFLYELSIWLVRWTEGKQKGAEEGAGNEPRPAEGS